MDVQGAEALAADSIAAKEWDELQQARKETEREMEEFTAAQARVVKEREMLQVAAAEQQSEQLKAEEKAQERGGDVHVVSQPGFVYKELICGVGWGSGWVLQRAAYSNLIFPLPNLGQDFLGWVGLRANRTPPPLL